MDRAHRPGGHDVLHHQEEALTEHTGIDRIDPPRAADETATLLAFLDYHRDTLRLKLAGLNAEQLATTLSPSDLTLGGMVKHLALVERWWFECVFRGTEYAEPGATVDWGWHSAAGDSIEELVAMHDRAVAISDEVIRSTTDLGRLSQRTGRDGTPFSMRWILCHMIEEYARHNGHADLIRQAIDGEVGE